MRRGRRAAGRRQHSYAVWHRQAVLGQRPDVVPVTLPLLGALWYRAEQRRRHGLLDAPLVATWHGDVPTLQAMIQGARRQGRAVAASVAVPRAVRDQLGAAWVLRGLVFTLEPGDSAARALGDRVDSASTAALAALISRRVPGAPGNARDGASRYVGRLLECPSLVLRASQARASGEAALLDSRCNFK